MVKFSLKKSSVIELLNDRLVKNPAVRTHGTIVWSNLDLLKELNLCTETPLGNIDEINQHLINLFSYRICDSHKEKGEIEIYADKYGGTGLSGNLGAGRAGFLPYNNVYLKGIGKTKLCQSADSKYSNGYISLEKCIYETIFGEINYHLHGKDSVRSLVIIDQHKFINNGLDQYPTALIARIGGHLRPAHLLAHSHGSKIPKWKFFLKITNETGQLIENFDELTGEKIPDFRATMMRVLEDHAQIAAEQFRWRMFHGAVSASNLSMNGAALDLETQTAQPRTAPIYVVNDNHSYNCFGKEHLLRAIELKEVYRSVIRSVPKGHRFIYNAISIDFEVEMDRLFEKKLEIEILCAIGLKKEFAQFIQTEHSSLIARLRDAFVRITQFKNNGSLNNKSVVNHVSVLDIFNLLQCYPKFYFKELGSNHDSRIVSALTPIFTGNKFHINKKRKTASSLIKEFSALYDELMNKCFISCDGYYENLNTFKNSVSFRAEFENKPLELLYRSKLLKKINDIIKIYTKSKNVEIISDFINETVFKSRRNVNFLQ